MGCEGVGKTQSSGELGAIKARTQNPNRYLRSSAGNGAHRLFRRKRTKVGNQLQDILGKGVMIAREVSAQGAHGALIGARRSPQKRRTE